MSTCSICLDEIEPQDMYTLEQCGHNFHANCIVRNIQTGNISCPCCRKLPPFVVDSGESNLLREDIIDEYNDRRRHYYHKKALKIINKGECSKKMLLVKKS